MGFVHNIHVHEKIAKSIKLKFQPNVGNYNQGTKPITHDGLKAQLLQNTTRTPDDLRAQILQLNIEKKI